VIVVTLYTTHGSARSLEIFEHEYAVAVFTARNLVPIIPPALKSY